MTWLLVIAVWGLTCLGQIAQKFAVQAWQASEWQSRGLVRKLSHPWFIAAVMCLGLGLLLWLLVLQRLDVGTAYPLLGFNFVLVTLAARYVFHEPVGRRHWLGVACIVAGVALLGTQS